MSAFPKVLPAPSSYGGGQYTRDEGRVALRETAPKEGAMRIVARDEAGAGDVVAVYESPSGELVAPTGMLFVRLAEGARAADRRGEIEALGLRIVKVPSFAPHSAYVRGEGGVAATLHLIEKVRNLRDVEDVEVEMFRVAERK